MSERFPTALASMSRGILRWAEQRGIDPSDVIGPDELAHLERAGDEGRIPRRLHDTIWQTIERLVSDPSFGLRSAETILSPSSLGVVGLIAMTSSTVGESLARSAKYSRVLKEDVVSQVSETEREITVALTAREPLSRAVADASLVAFHHFVGQWTGRAVAVKAVYFRHGRPADTSPYDRFGCPVHFDQPTDAIAFDRDVRDVPLVTAQPEVARYLESVAETKLGEIAAVDASRLTLRAAIEEALLPTIHEGDVAIEGVAKRLGTSVRSLQRALATEGLSYRRVVDELRLRLAAPLVTGTDRPLERIAEELGYSDGKAFRRAFRRWAGVAPVEYRRGKRL